jgi:fructose-1,6-bisphosphatase/inositol monophosphatase family enzyme
MRLTDTMSDAVSDLMREAAERFILPRYLKLTSAEIAEKAARDFVTIADRESEAFLLRHLGTLLPGSIATGEESIHRVPALIERLSDDSVWLIDPLDGTRNFVEGRPDFAVMVSLLEKGEASAAWIYFPIGNLLIETRRSGGTRIGADRVICSAGQIPARLHGSIVRAGTPEVYLDAFDNHGQELAGQCEERFSAAAECLALLTGELDFGFYWRTLPWDHAPCCLAIREAGGVCRRLDGTDYRVNDRKSGLITARTPAVDQKLHHWLGVH